MTLLPPCLLIPLGSFSSSPTVSARPRVSSVGGSLSSRSGALSPPFFRVGSRRTSQVNHSTSEAVFRIAKGLDRGGFSPRREGVLKSRCVAPEPARRDGHFFHQIVAQEFGRRGGKRGTEEGELGGPRTRLDANREAS